MTRRAATHLRLGTTVAQALAMVGLVHCGQVAPSAIGDTGARDAAAQPADAVSADARSELGQPWTPADFAPAAAEHAAVWCERLAACEARLSLLRFGDIQSCERRIASQWQSLAHVPGTTLTPESLTACAHALAGTDCLDWRQDLLPEVCRPQGLLLPESRCVSSWQCPAGGFCSVSPEFCIAGVCPIGRSCGGLCYAQKNRTCRINDSCQSNEAVCCVRGLMCDGVCRLPPGEGQACNEVYGCDSLQLLECVEGVCRHTTIAMGGEPCDVSTPCVGTHHCAGVCTPLVPEGGACSGGQVCELPATCVEGVCRIEDPPACSG